MSHSGAQCRYAAHEVSECRDQKSSVETHAVQLVRHLTDLYKRRRFTDLKVWSPTLLFRTYGDSRFRRSTANNSYHPYRDRCDAAVSCSRCTRAL